MAALADLRKPSGAGQRIRLEDMTRHGLRSLQEEAGQSRLDDSSRMLAYRQLKLAASMPVQTAGVDPLAHRQISLPVAFHAPMARSVAVERALGA